MKIKILASSRGKTPSCYVNRVFELTKTIAVGDPMPTVGNGKTFSTFSAYTSTMKNGKPVLFTHYSAEPRWFVRRPDRSAGTWLYNVEIVG